MAMAPLRLVMSRAQLALFVPPILLGLAGAAAITCGSRPSEAPPLAPRPEPTTPGAPAPAGGDGFERPAPEPASTDARPAPISSAAPDAAVEVTPASAAPEDTSAGARSAQVEPPIEGPIDEPIDPDPPLPGDAGADAPFPMPPDDAMMDAPPPPLYGPGVQVDAGMLR